MSGRQYSVIITLKKRREIQCLIFEWTFENDCYIKSETYLICWRNNRKRNFWQRRKRKFAVCFDYLLQNYDVFSESTDEDVITEFQSIPIILEGNSKRRYKDNLNTLQYLRYSYHIMYRIFSYTFWNFIQFVLLLRRPVHLPNVPLVALFSWTYFRTNM